MWQGLPKTDSFGKEYAYTVQEQTFANFTPVTTGDSADGFVITNTYVSPYIPVKAVKIWDGGDAANRPEVQFELWRKNGTAGSGELVVGAIVVVSDEVDFGDQYETDANGVKYEYYVKEVGALTDYEKTENGLVVTNKYVSPKADVTATKEWVGGSAIARPNVTFQLYRNGETFGMPVMIETAFGASSSSYTWAGLDVNDKNGQAYTYTVKEINLMAPWVKSEIGLTVKNTYESPIIDINVEKIWVDELTVHPDVEISLLRDGEVVDSIVLGEEYGWTHTWSVDETDEEGNPYTYTVAELVVPQSYVAMVDGSVEDGFVITNTYFTPGKGGGEPVEPKSPALADTGLNSYLAVLSGMMLAGIGIYLLPIRRQQ